MRADTLLRPLVLLGVSALFAPPLPAQQDTREAVRALEARFPPLRFHPPSPRQLQLSNGIQVFLLEDHSVPLLSVNLIGRMGVANLPDSLWAAGWVADGMMRTGGTTTLAPDSVDRLVDFYALDVGLVTGYENSTAFVSGLSRYRDAMLDLLFDLMRNPRDDTARIRERAARAEETWRRRNDQPGSILDRAWNQVMMGDHPFARSLVTPQEAQALAPARLQLVQHLLYCPQRFVIGVTGDFVERELIAKLESLFRGWRRCGPGLREIPPLHYAQGPKVVLIDRDVDQSNVRMGQAGGIYVANTPDYFGAQVADFLLGGGGGFNSRLLQRVRSDSGFAYDVFSDWSADTKRERIFAAGAEVRAEKTVAALSLIRDVIGSMGTDPVTDRDVQLARDNETNSFVFRFETPADIVGQQLSYVVDGLPPNWFDLYLRGIQAVSPSQVTGVVQKYLHPDHLVIVVVGKANAFDGPLSKLGPVTTMKVEDILR
jgi:predicted Zn-dependent peptidase